MLAVESDTEFSAQLPLYDTDVGESTIGCGVGSSSGGVGAINDERREDVAVLTSEDGVRGQISSNAKRNEYKSSPKLLQLRKFCRIRQGAVLLLGVFLTVLALTLVVVGGVKSRQHSGIHLLHMQTPVNLKSLMYLGEENFTFGWELIDPYRSSFRFLVPSLPPHHPPLSPVQLMTLTNVALDRPASQSSVAIPDTEIEDDAVKAVDGSLSTCSNTALERRPEWQVDLQKSRIIKSIRIHGSNNFSLQNLVVHVTVSNITSSESLCGKATSPARGYYTHVKCGARLRGRYIVIELDNPPDSFQSLRLCEVMVFSGIS